MERDLVVEEVEGLKVGLEVEDHQVLIDTEVIIVRIQGKERISFLFFSSFFYLNFSRSGSSFKSNAMSFGAGALGGLAAYSLMRSMSSSYRSRPGYYEPGYGGKTCYFSE
jgi:hypothetical protein